MGQPTRRASDPGWPWAWWDPPEHERELVAAVLAWARRRPAGGCPDRRRVRDRGRAPAGGRQVQNFRPSRDPSRADPAVGTRRITVFYHRPS